MAGRYRIREFSRLSGITVRALQLYDRLGLLSPSRTGAGHRVYTSRDLDTVGQIIALKFLGLPLKQIGAVLGARERPLTEVLRHRRQTLERQRSRLDRAIGAIAGLEDQLGRGDASDARLLKQLVEVIGMNDEAEAMRQYFSPRAWGQFQHYWSHWPPPRWRELIVLSSLHLRPRARGGPMKVPCRVPEGVYPLRLRLNHGADSPGRIPTLKLAV